MVVIPARSRPETRRFSLLHVERHTIDTVKAPKLSREIANVRVSIGLSRVEACGRQ